MSKQPCQRSVLRSIISTFVGERPGQHPPAEEHTGWIAYWQARNQPWRTEPEIDTKRQKQLARRRAIVPNIEQGIYPFRGMKLSRADVEWLLANHEDGGGPVDWNDEKQRNRNGIDVRGADLRQEDLRNLPLACMRGGLTWEEWESAIPERRTAAGVHLEDADLRWAHLEGAILTRAHLERAALREAYLEQANLRSAYLERATFQRAHLEQATLRRAHLDRVSFVEAYLAGTDFRGAYLEGANFFKAHLEGVLKLEKNGPVELPPADLRGAFLDAVSHLEEATLGEKRFGFVSLADLHWGEANLAVVNWTVVNMLGDEFKARQLKEHDGKVEAKGHQVREYMEAVRANRQLATALQGQGLNEQAARFAYRAQMLQRVVFWRQRKIGSYLFSLFLDLMMGYGYRPARSFFAYLLVISGFAIAYYLLGHAVGPSLSPLGALVLSMTSFHGRGFFPGGIALDDPLTVLAALEAFVGLLIEVTFIATLTRRLFGH